MANTSGVAAFNLDLSEIVEEAFERAGLEIRTGYEFRTARRSLNMLTIEWANRGINLWTIEQGQINLYPYQSIYALPIDTIDLLDQVTRTGVGQNQQDININRISESTYSTIPNKNAQGRPIQVWINRQSGESNAVTATLGGEEITVAMLDHTKNFGYPAHWHARTYGLFSVNNFGSKVYVTSDPEQKFELVPEKSVEFRHRILIFSGTMPNGFMTEQFADFNR